MNIAGAVHRDITQPHGLISDTCPLPCNLTLRRLDITLSLLPASLLGARHEKVLIAKKYTGNRPKL